jgi:ceramide glucosyltransferase
MNESTKGTDDLVLTNPKINNLIRPFRRAKHDIIWLLDSNISVLPTTLSTSTSLFLSSPQIGVLHHPPVAAFDATSSNGQRALGYQIESTYLSTSLPKVYLTLNQLKLESCVMGKSNIFRKSVISQLRIHPPPSSPSTLYSRNEEKTGLEAFANCLVEDNAIASALHYQLHLLHVIPEGRDAMVRYHLPKNMSFKEHINRRMGWIRVRKHMVLYGTFLEPFSESLVSGGITSFFLSHFLSIPPLWSFSVHMGMWWLSDLAVYYYLNGLIPRRKFEFARAWVLREIMAFPIFIIACFGSRVEWRGEVYSVDWSGVATKVSA